MNIDNLREVLGEENSMEIPGDYAVKCHDCCWSGKYNECGEEEESDGWEHPVYMVPVCPECGTGIEI